jgi:hypothetical protein
MRYCDTEYFGLYALVVKALGTAPVLKLEMSKTGEDPVLET